MSFLSMVRKNDIKELGRYLEEHDANEVVQGKSLLYWTFHQGNVEFAKLLIKKGANVNQRDGLGKSILSVAAFYGFTELVRLLLKHNATVDVAAMDRAYYGWDGYIQTDILDLFRENQYFNVFLDDLRDIPKGFVSAKTVEQAIDLIENNQVHILSLDHDLGMDEEGNLLPTGYDLVKYICENGLRINRVYIHSDNPVGRENMFQTLKSAQRRNFISADIEIHHYPITKNTYSSDNMGPLMD